MYIIRIGNSLIIESSLINWKTAYHLVEYRDNKISPIYSHNLAFHPQILIES